MREDIEQVTPKIKPMDPPRLYDVQICDDTRLAAGSNGIMFISRDGGKNWRVINSGIEDDLMEVTFHQDCDSALIAGDRGAILRVSDDGNEIQHIDSNASNFNGIALSASDNTAIAVGDNGTIRVSEDGGRNWIDAGNIVGNDLNDVAVSTDGKTVVVVGDRETQAYSTESGKRDTWNLKALPNNKRADFESVTFNGKGKAVAVGENGLINIYDPEMNTIWAPAAIRKEDSERDFNAVAFSEEGNTAITVGDDGATLVSVNNKLQDWKRKKTKVGDDLNDVSVAPNGRSAVAVGDSGTVLLLTDIDGDWCKPDSKTANDLFAVSFDRENNIAVAVGREDDQPTLITLDAGDCSAPVNRVNVKLPEVEVSEKSSISRGSVVDSETEFVVSYLAIFAVRILAVVMFLIVFWQMVNLTRYYLRLTAFYDGKADAILMIDPKNPPRSKDIETFERSAKVVTPEDIGFDRTPRSVIKEAIQIALAIVRRQNNGNDLRA